jgi:hypothetical protein
MSVGRTIYHNIHNVKERAGLGRQLPQADGWPV